MASKYILTKEQKDSIRGANKAGKLMMKKEFDLLNRKQGDWYLNKKILAIVNEK